MLKQVAVRSTVIDWQAETLEITDTDANKYTVGLDARIHVVMLGFPEREEKILKAQELGGYMSKGYIIEKILFEEESTANE